MTASEERWTRAESVGAIALGLLWDMDECGFCVCQYVTQEVLEHVIGMVCDVLGAGDYFQGEYFR